MVCIHIYIDPRRISRRDEISMPKDRKQSQSGYLDRRKKSARTMEKRFRGLGCCRCPQPTPRPYTSLCSGRNHRIKQRSKEGRKKGEAHPPTHIHTHTLTYRLTRTQAITKAEAGRRGVTESRRPKIRSRELLLMHSRARLGTS